MNYVDANPVTRVDVTNSKYLTELLTKCEPGKGFTIPAHVVLPKGTLSVKMNYYGKKMNCRFRRCTNADKSIFVWREQNSEFQPDTPVGMEFR